MLFAVSGQQFLCVCVCVSAALGFGMSQWRSNKTLLMPLWTHHRWAEKMLSRKLEAAKTWDNSNSNPGSEAKGLEK